jgi:colicin import membrane protein/protein TonB
VSTATAAPQSALLVGQRDRLWPMVAVSLVVHAALIALAAWHRPPAVLDLNQKPIVARLARYGELRPKHYMPRKEASPPPGPPAPVVSAPTPPPAPAPPPAPEPPKAAPAPAPAPKVAEAPPAPKPGAMPPPKAEPAKAQPTQAVAQAPAAARPAAGGGGGLASALSRVQRDQKVYGSPDGDPLGDAEEGEGDAYLALVTRALQETYTLPATISDRERMHLRATVLLFIEPDGRVSRYEFESRSGNPTFDGALESAVRSARLPPPPAERRDRYRSQGLAVLYRP